MRNKPTYSKPHWRPEEDDLLFSFMGELPPRLVHIQLNALANKRGWQQRSYPSVLRRARALGLSVHCHGLYITVTALADLLGIPRSTVADWCEVGDVIPTKIINRLRYIRRKDLRAWARRHPRKLSFASRGALVSALESEELADWVLEHPPLRRLGKIKCLQTGRIYHSARSAASREFLHHTSISQAIREGRPAQGKTFRLVTRRGAA